MIILQISFDVKMKNNLLVALLIISHWMKNGSLIAYWNKSLLDNDFPIRHIFVFYAKDAMRFCVEMVKCFISFQSYFSLGKCFLIKNPTQKIKYQYDLHPLQGGLMNHVLINILHKPFVDAWLASYRQLHAVK